MNVCVFWCSRKNIKVLNQMQWFIYSQPIRTCSMFTFHFLFARSLALPRCIISRQLFIWIYFSFDSISFCSFSRSIEYIIKWDSYVNSASKRTVYTYIVHIQFTIDIFASHCDRCNFQLCLVCMTFHRIMKHLAHYASHSFSSYTIFLLFFLLSISFYWFPFRWICASDTFEC